MSWLPAERAVHLASSALVAGGLAFELLLLRRAPEAARAPQLALRVRRRARALAALGIALGLLSWLAWLAEVTLEMSGLPLAEALSPDALRLVLGGTTFGHVWALRAVLLLLVFPPLLLRKAPPARPFDPIDAAALLAAALLLGSLAWTGHAVADTPAHLAADAAHLCAAALWIGMLAPLAFLVHQACATRDASALRLAGEAARLFSAPGITAVVVLVGTGLLNTWWLVGSVDALVQSDYGHLLLAKLALFALMIVLAAMNRAVLSPRIGPPDARGLVAARALRRNVIAEAVLALGVLAVVGSLGVRPPPAHQHPVEEPDAPEQEHAHGHEPAV